VLGVTTMFTAIPLLLRTTLVAFFTMSAAQAQQFWPTEEISVSSHTFTDEQFLAGNASDGTAISLTAVLVRRPEAEGPRPVVVLLHGTDGPMSNAVSAWRLALSTLGYSVIRLDSYTGRGLTQASTDQSSVSQFAQIYDAYRLVEALANNPHVDPRRVVLMGFSRGATAALYASLARFNEMYGPQAGAIVGHIPFYAGCNFELKDDQRTNGAPIHAFHGGADDWTSAQTCRAYIDSLASNGADASITIYPEAYHAFDSPIPPFLLAVRDAQSSFGCMRVEAEGVLLNRETGKPFTYSDACVTTDPHVKSDPAAFALAQEAVAAFLAQTLRP